MLPKDDKNESKKFTFPSKLEFAYKNFKPLAEAFSYRVFEAEARISHEKHVIRILDRTKEYVNKNYALAATLFVQELLRLQYRYPGSVLINTFEVSENGDQLACATLPYIPLGCQLGDNKGTINYSESKMIEKLLSDVLSDVEFLWKDLQVRKIMDVLGAENISFMQEKNAFFLVNWAKIYEDNASEAGNITRSTTYISEESQKKKLSSQDLAAELKGLVFAVLKMRKIDHTEVQSLLAMPDLKIKTYDSAVRFTLEESFSDSEKLRNLLGKMLSLDLRSLPSLEELRIKEGTLTISNSEESKKSRDEFQSDSLKNALRIIGNILSINSILSFL